MRMTYNWIRDYCPAEWSAEEAARRLSLAGCLVEEIYPLGDDTLFVSEITSNRPDLLGAMGIARELSALCGVPLRVPESSFSVGTEKIDTVSSVEVPALDLCPRYTARLVRGVKIGPSPDWLRRRLEAVNLRPVNNVVDVTNYVLFECGQPLHAFDFDKLRGGKIIVRRAGDGEEITVIDGSKIKLKSSMLVIADTERPVAVAGIMGGLDTEISQGTVNVLLESAHFENTQIRRTSRALQLSSDASYRFERGVDPVQTEWASRRACHLIQQVAGGVVDEGILDVWAKAYVPAEISLRYARLNKLLGTAVGSDVVKAILERLGFKAVGQSDPRRLVVQVPPFRANDVTREVDLIEEVIRVYGYDKLPETSTLPAKVGQVSAYEQVLDVTRRVLTGLGYFDVITNTFTTEAAAKLISVEPGVEPLLVQNTIRRDENRLRVSILPGLLAVKRTNQAHGVPRAPVFEVGRVYLPRVPRTEGEPNRNDRLPRERQFLAVLSEDDLLTLKGVIDALAEALGLPALAYERTASDFFAEGRAARLLLKGRPIGVMGEVAKAVADGYDLVHAPCMAEIDFDALVEAANLERKYQPLPQFPAAVRDLAVVVDEAVPWSLMESVIRGLNILTLERIEFFDVFRGKQIPAGKKSIALSLTFRAPDRTLTSEEVEFARQACINALAAIGGQLRG